jgi:hypothetical protein
LNLHDTPLVSEKVFASYDAVGSLARLSKELLEEQKEHWQQLAEGYASLASVNVREIVCNGFSVYLQCNPRRIVSTGANVDAKAISERKCFLCMENLPPAQKGVLYKDEFVVLCNPAPIFSGHLTISNVEHVPQTIESYIGVMLELAKDLSPEFSVFYNGPKCGASAPDHMHFQGCPVGMIPVERDAVDAKRRNIRAARDGVSILSLEKYGRQVLVFESSDKSALKLQFKLTIDGMRTVFAVNEEPMMNIICSYQNDMWRVIFFPRRKHRPDAYFKEGDERVLISPAAVDIGGLIVTPLKHDFERVDATMVEQIFEEVSIERSVFEILVRWIEQQNQMFPLATETNR